MNYISTRGYTQKVSASRAILDGIAPDGGLYIPEYVPQLSSDELLGLYNKDYQSIAQFILEKYITDFTQNQLENCISGAYNPNTFASPLICPIRPLDDVKYLLELWHGPTCAFKDLALQLLPHLLTNSAKKLDETNTLVILVATSGDTGKAALEGFKDVPDTKVIVFYPENGVSEIQKLQMITQEGSNVHVIGVKGNFDDAQTGVKEIFSNPALNSSLNAHGYGLTSANSINWGRLVPQIVYYFSSYIYMMRASHIKFGDKINICVPTGNFGNIMAAFYAKKMGLPVNKLIIATNHNDVLAKTLQTGIYNANRELETTISPSMDILVSSNFERLLFEVSEHNSQEISNLMKELKNTGKYHLDTDLHNKIKNDFFADFASEKNTLKTIKDIFKKYKYVVDPHTAVAVHVHDKYIKKTGDLTKTLIDSTASPYKFNASVMKALTEASTITNNEFELLNLLSVTSKTLIPQQLKNLSGKTVLHNSTCEKTEMKEIVKNILNVKA